MSRLAVAAFLLPSAWRYRYQTLLAFPAFFHPGPGRDLFAVTSLYGQLSWSGMIPYSTSTLWQQRVCSELSNMIDPLQAQLLDEARRRFCWLGLNTQKGWENVGSVGREVEREVGPAVDIHRMCFRSLCSKFPDFLLFRYNQFPPATSTLCMRD